MCKIKFNSIADLVLERKYWIWCLKERKNTATPDHVSTDISQLYSITALRYTSDLIPCTFQLSIQLRYTTQQNDPVLTPGNDENTSKYTLLKTALVHPDISQRVITACAFGN
jgi:hypothetical protein